ncbi:hypothetical protein [Asticcacaulis sp.]
MIGKTHFVRSLRTGRWADAVRMIRWLSNMAGSFDLSLVAT